jgi:hypothetical protein
MFLTSGALSRFFVQKELRTARRGNIPVLLVRETDVRHGALSFEEVFTALTVLHSLYCTHCTALTVLHSLYCTHCTALTVLHSLYCTDCTALTVLH